MKKKLYLLFLFIISLLVVTVPAWAEPVYDSLPESPEYQDILALEPEMLSWLSGMGTSDPDHPEAALDVSEAVLSYENAAKVYVETGLEYLDSDSEEDICAYLETCNYVWVIPGELPDQHIRITVARGLPLNPDAAPLLSEEEKAQIQENEGKWQISEAAIQMPEFYRNQLQTTAQEYDRILFVGGMPGLQQPMALGFQEQKAAVWIDLGYSYPVLEGAAQPLSSDSGLYAYEEVINRARGYIPPSGDTGGGGDSQDSAFPGEYASLIVCVSLMGALLLIVFISWGIRKLRERLG